MLAPPTGSRCRTCLQSGCWSLARKGARCFCARHPIPIEPVGWEGGREGGMERGREGGREGGRREGGMEGGREEVREGGRGEREEREKGKSFINEVSVY